MDSGKEIKISFAGIDMKNYKRRMMSIMKKKKVGSIWGKAAVASMVIISMVSGNVVAKAADVPVNQMFSKNVEVVTTEEVEVIETTDDVFNADLGYIEYESIGEFTEIELYNTPDVTYKIIYRDDTTELLMDGQAQVEPSHVHTIKDVIIKEHKKASDGSCTTTYYDGKKCTSCGVTWKGDVINEMSFTKCPH